MAAAASRLVNIGKNGALRSLIHRNLLRSSAGPISQSLNSNVESGIPIPFNTREVSALNTSSNAAAEALKMMTPGLGVSYGMMGLPGIDQSGTGRVFLKSRNDQKDQISYDDDNHDFDDDDDGDGPFSDLDACGVNDPASDMSDYCSDSDSD